MTMIAAACGGDDNNDKAKGDNNGSTNEGGAKGGSIVIGAEQFPECLNPITQCSNSSWMHWAVDEHVLPKLVEIDPDGNFVKSDLLTELPSVDNGGLKENPFTVTYHLNPKAVWDDGTPITSSDIKFSLDAYMQTAGALSTVGYKDVQSIDDSDPHTAVLTFKNVFTDWQDIFGGNQGYVLKKAAFPNGPETSKEMQTSLSFSGRPWKLQSFSNQQAVLVRNDKYWVADEVARLDKVTMVPRTDQDTEINSLNSGEVSAIFPQPSPGFSKKLSAPNIKYVVGAGTQYEALWPNLSKKPLDDPKVRQALFMAVDRQALVNSILRPDAPETKILNCLGAVPTVGKWCDNTVFADIKYDPEGAKKVLQGDGWTLGSDGIFEKNGQKLDLEFNTVSGNTRRENMQQLITAQAKKAGITFHVKNYDSTTLFQTVIPQLGHTVGIYAQVASPDPSVSSIFACDQIPGPSNGGAGQNNSAWCNQQATTVMKQADNELDNDKRADLTHQGQQFMRDDYVALPFWQLPLVTAWRTDKLTGPLDEYTNSASYTAFYNMNKWSLKK